MKRLTKNNWRNLDHLEFCGQDRYCKLDYDDDGGCTKGCIIPNLYDRLAAYEDTGLEPEEIKRIYDEYGRGMTIRTSSTERLSIIKDIPTDELREEVKKWKHKEQPNAPLTLEELREMVGKPVWVISMDEIPDWRPCWVICMEDYILVHSSTKESRVYFLRENTDYGKTWLAYRQKLVAIASADM